jgi:hypothetical protein
MEALQIQLLTRASPACKMEMLGQLNASARLLALIGLRVARAEADALDRDYLREWARELKVNDLLERAFKEST